MTLGLIIGIFLVGLGIHYSGVEKNFIDAMGTFICLTFGFFIIWNISMMKIEMIVGEKIKNQTVVMGLMDIDPNSTKFHLNLENPSDCTILKEDDGAVYYVPKINRIK